MRAEYRRDLTGSYMVLKDTGSDGAAEGFEMKTLLANRVRGIFRMQFRHMDGKTCCECEITGLRPFAAFCETQTPGLRVLRDFFSALFDELADFEDYLLNPARLLLDPEYLYLERERCVPVMAYLPGRDVPLGSQLTALTEYLLMKSEPGDSGGVLLLCRILKELKKGDVSIPELRRCLDGEAEAYRAGHEEAYRVGREEAVPERGASLPFENEEAWRQNVPHEAPDLTEEDRPVFQGAHPSALEVDHPVYDFADEARKKAGEDGVGWSAVNGGRRERSRAESGRQERLQLLPDGYGLILCAFMAAAAAIVWSGLQFQKIFILTAAEKAAGAAAGAALILICALITNAVLNRLGIGDADGRIAAAGAAAGGAWGAAAGVVSGDAAGAVSGDAARAVSGAAAGAVSGAAARAVSGAAAGLASGAGFGAVSGEASKMFSTPYRPGRKYAAGEGYGSGRVGKADSYTDDPYAGSSDAGGSYADAPYPGRDNSFGGYRDVRNGSPGISQLDGAYEERRTISLEGYMEAQAASAASLVPAEGAGRLPVLSLTAKETTIGHSRARADRWIPDRAVSRLHARITNRDGKYFLSDLGSRNGTAVAGRAVVGRSEVQLREGDPVTFAGCEYIFHDAGGSNQG